MILRPQHNIDDSQHQLRLAPDARVDRVDRHVRTVGDGSHRRVGVALAREQVPR